MAESNDVQTLEKISTEVDESQFKIILSSQCIKAQAYLVDKLRKQSEQQKQICNFISNGNLKLETEIKIAEQEVKSLHNGLDTIKIANVELKKELLIAKEMKRAVIERVNNGIKKYNEFWTVSKKRYESIPFIQNYLQIKNKSSTLQDNILKLTNEMQKLSNDINIRKRELLNLDREYIIQVAKFMVQEKPQIIQSIREKSKNVEELRNDIQRITKKYDVASITAASKSTPIKSEQNNKKKEVIDVIEDSWPNLSTDIDNAVMLPKLQLRNIDLDILTIKLDQIKKVDSQNVSKGNESELTSTIEQIPTKRIKTDEIVNDVYISTYFKSPKQSITNMDVTEYQTKTYSEKKLIHILEDIKLNSIETYNIVSNINPNSLQDVDVIKADAHKETINANKCVEEKIDTPICIENEKIEEIDLTKSQSSNILVPPTQFLDLTQRPEAKIVASNFFFEKDNNFDNTKKVQVVEIEDESSDDMIASQQLDDQEQKNKDKNTMKTQNNKDKTPQDMPVTGFLFTHGLQGIPDSLNVSTSTMGYDDADVDCPPCIDSSLLLSPKAEDQLPETTDNSQILSQEVPNFLSGIRKTGFSFFEKLSSQDKPDAPEQNQSNNFAFSFGSTEKKSRGGFFSMFH